MHIVCPQCGATNRVEDSRIMQNPICGKCTHPIMENKPIALTDQALMRFIQKTELPILVDFWAEWCGPCRAMAPQFTQAAQLAPDIRFVKIDSDACPLMSQQFGIRSIPSLLLFKNGRELGRQSGVMPAKDLLDWARSTLQKSQ